MDACPIVVMEVEIRDEMSYLAHASKVSPVIETNCSDLDLDLGCFGGT